MMDNFFILVTLVAIVYAILVRKIQFTFGNQEEMKKFQEESKVLQEELKKATKENNQARVDRLMEQQKAMFPKMGGMMMGQFKTMGIILILLFGLSTTLNFLDDSHLDDVIVQLNDAGMDCDLILGDSIYSGCYTPETENYGTWTIKVNAYDQNNNSFSQDMISFGYKERTGPGYVDKNGDPIELELDKEIYSPGDLITVTAKPSKVPSRMDAAFNMGTWFYVDLPFTIPILEIQRIHTPYWWFIFVAIIGGLIITPIYKKLFIKEKPVVK